MTETDDGPFVNGTHYCINCNLQLANRAPYKYAFGCGCGDWKPFYDGCCFKKGEDSHKLCSLNKVVPSFFNGSTLPKRYLPSNINGSAHQRSVISMKLQHVPASTKDNEAFSVLPVVGSVVLLLIVVVLAVRIYVCVNVRQRRKRMANYNFQRDISLSLEILAKSKV